MSRRGRRRFTTTVVAVLVALIAAVVLVQYSIDQGPGGGSWDDSAPFEASRSVLDVLGGVRETLAAYFWTKTDDLFHSYLGGSMDKEDLVVPYYWMVTRLDPRFEMPFYFASWLLCRLGRVDEGFDLAVEGLRNNPGSAELQYNLASIYFFFKKDPEKARYHIERAIELAPTSEDADVYRTFLGLVEMVLRGEREIPDVSTIEKAEDLHREQHRHEHEEGGEEHHEHEGE